MNPGWDHGGPPIYLVLIYVMRFVKTTSQPKFQSLRSNGSGVIAVLKKSKMQTSYFADQI